MVEEHRSWWTRVILIAVALVGILLLIFVQQTTTQITEALADESLQQQHDVARLTHQYLELILALERERRDAKQFPRSLVQVELDDALIQLKKMRFRYSFERMDGAAKAYAFVKPVLEDVQQWLQLGVPGYPPNDEMVLHMSIRRLTERYQALSAIVLETNHVATSLLATQTRYLDRFRASLISLLGMFALLALGITALLIRQRTLQRQRQADRKAHEQRVSDFAEIGADWFWELSQNFKVKLLSGRSFAASKDEFSNAFDIDLDLDADGQVELPLSGNKSADIRWPVISLRRKKEFSDYESSWIAPDGSTRIISLSGKPLHDVGGEYQGFRGIGRDITDRKNIELQLEKANRELIEAQTKGREQAEKALRDSEQFLRTSLDAMSPNIVILDRYGFIITANSAWVAFANSNSSSYADGGIGQHYLDIFQSLPEEERLAISGAEGKISSVLAAQTDSMRYEFPFHTVGQQRCVMIQLTTFESNGMRYAVMVYEDVTERKLLEEHDRRLRAELADVARMATGGEMASGLAHELNQPLTAISHNCDALLSSLCEGQVFIPEHTNTIKDIYEQSLRAGGIIRGIRQLVRKDVVSTARVNINKLVIETVRLTHPHAQESRVDVLLQLADELPEPSIDAVQIQQVLVNLERNGVDAIRMGDSLVRRLFICTALENKRTIRITVRDSGPGVELRMRKKLFNVFQTTKKEGMGMGLSISRSIVEAHGGRLWLDEAVSGLTTFHFTLPIDRG